LASLSELTRTQAERVAGLLAKQGEVQSAQVGRVAEDLVRRTQKNREIMSRLVQREVKRQLGVLGMATRDEVARLQQRVRALEQELERSSRSTPASAAGPAEPGPAARAGTRRAASAAASRASKSSTRTKAAATKPATRAKAGGSGTAKAATRTRSGGASSRSTASSPRTRRPKGSTGSTEGSGGST
jgi:polyhydroxyalkanoate synthesis regulator phasin